jgi:hypothetical protein
MEWFLEQQKESINGILQKIGDQQKMPLKKSVQTNKDFK